MHEWWAVGVRREGTTQQREKRMRGAFLVAHSHRVNGGVAGTHFASSHVVIFFHAHDEPTAHCPVLHLRTSPRPCVVLHVVAQNGNHRPIRALREPGSGILVSLVQYVLGILKVASLQTYVVALVIYTGRARINLFFFMNWREISTHGTKPVASLTNDDSTATVHVC